MYYLSKPLYVITRLYAGYHLGPKWVPAKRQYWSGDPEGTWTYDRAKAFQIEDKAFAHELSELLHASVGAGPARVRMPNDQDLTEN